ncbi:MAG: acyloxyacyl hydrolase [Deltaproteobacteria bacterium]|nr:acyloxyacyl hydrolase [Deltaproteobacteria bacterium]
MKILRIILWSICLSLIYQPVSALDGISINTGFGSDDTTMTRVGLEFKWDKKWFAESSWYLTGQWEGGFALWKGSRGTSGNDLIAKFDITPVLRLNSRTLYFGVIQPYLDGGVGAHLLMDRQIGDIRMAEPLLFGSQVGGGLAFGPNRIFDLGYHFQHLSNAGINNPNPSFNFHLVSVACHF